jgi:outer membrane protein
MAKIRAVLGAGLILGLAIFCLVSPSFAAESKIGYIDISRAFDEYTRTKEADAALEKKGNEKEVQREKMVNDVKKLKEELDLASDKIKQEKQKLLDDKIKTLQDYDRTVRDDLRKERDSLVREILQEIDTVIQEVGKKDGYTFILNDRVLLYKEKPHDLTDKIINILNERYQKKAKQ